MKPNRSNLKVNSILFSTLLLITFSCRKPAQQNTIQETFTSTDTLTTTPQEVELTIEEKIAYRFEDLDEQFAEFNNAQSECNIAISNFMKSTNLGSVRVDLFNIYIHSQDGNKIKLNMKKKEDDLWIEIDLEAMYVNNVTNIENIEPLFYDAKLWHKMLTCCFPSRAQEVPISEYFRNSNDLKFYQYEGEYYSANTTIECISPYKLEETYKQLVARDIHQGEFLLDYIPTKDTTYNIGESTFYEYTLAPNLQITITHPTAGQDHYLFEKYGDSIKITKEIEPN